VNWRQQFSILLFAGLAALSGLAQTTGKYLAPRDQLIAIRAGRLFDARSGMMLTNQVVIVRSDRIAEVPAAKMQGVFNWNDAVAGYPLSPRGQADFIRDLVAVGRSHRSSLWHSTLGSRSCRPWLGTDVDVRAEWQDRSCSPRPRRDSRSYFGRTLSQRATKHSEAGADLTSGG